MLHAFLCLLPALVLVLPLLARRYPGERLLLALRDSERRRFPRARSAPAPRARLASPIVRGGLLLARSLAVRPPPAVGAAS